MRRITIEEAAPIANEYADTMTADRVKNWRDHPLKRLKRLQTSLLESCDYKKAIYVGYIINNYRDLLLLPSDGFMRLYNDFFYRWSDDELEATIDFEGKEMVFKDTVLWAMRYEDIRNEVLPDIIYKLNINVCVYCNETAITTTEPYTDSDGNVKRNTRYQIDHFWPQSKFPYLSTSFYNFQPSCGPCNNIKGAKSILFNLYTKSGDQTIQNPFKFTFGDESLLMEAILRNDWHDIQIHLTAPNDNPLESNHDEVFHIDALYVNEKHRIEVLRIAQKFYDYSPSYAQSIKDSIPAFANIQETVLEESFKDLGYFLHENLVHFKELNKLAIDVMQYMEIIE